MLSKNKLSTNQQSGFLLTGSIIAILIAFSPYIFYLYEIFPNGPVWENSFFTYKSLYYENVLTAAWTYLGKITPLFLLLIWFFTCKHWWYHVILVPIGNVFFSIVIAFYEDAFMDIRSYGYATNLSILLPFLFLFFLLVYLIRIKDLRSYIWY